jgi:hypothetical protein
MEVLLDNMSEKQKELFDILSSKSNLKDEIKELASQWVKVLKEQLDKLDTETI